MIRLFLLLSAFFCVFTIRRGIGYFEPKVVPLKERVVDVIDQEVKDIKPPETDKLDQSWLRLFFTEEGNLTTIMEGVMFSLVTVVLIGLCFNL